MKKHLVKSTSILFVILTMIICAIPFASAATLLDETKKVSVTMNCTKPGYTFELFRVADLTTTSGTTNETAYTPLFDSIASEVKAGNSKNLLSKLDTLSPVNTAMPTGAVSCGTFTSSASSTTKTYSNLAQGIYYVKCTKYPAGVKSVTNSVFALPYYQNNSWVYTLSAINLANKVADGTATTKKEITNSTKNNVNYTDVSVGDTVEYALYNTVAGSTTNKLEQYTVKDKMSKGLTFNKDSVKVYLADSSKTKIADLTKDTDYKLNVTSEGTGKDTEFNVALNNTYLAKNDFYDDDNAQKKMVSCQWNVVERNHTLYGMVEFKLKEPFTSEEKELVRNWCIGQASDGLGEGLEQRPIETEDGDLYVSMWNSGDDYFMYDEDEMNEYLAQQGGMTYQ